jgi:hypothetical protein
LGCNVQASTAAAVHCNDFGYRIAALRQNHSQPHMLGEKFGAAREFIELAKKRERFTLVQR